MKGKVNEMKDCDVGITSNRDMEIRLLESGNEPNKFSMSIHCGENFIVGYVYNPIKENEAKRIQKKANKWLKAGHMDTAMEILGGNEDIPNYNF